MPHTGCKTKDSGGLLKNRAEKSMQGDGSMNKSSSRSAPASQVSCTVSISSCKPVTGILKPSS